MLGFIKFGRSLNWIARSNGASTPYVLFDGIRRRHRFLNDCVGIAKILCLHGNYRRRRCRPAYVRLMTNPFSPKCDLPSRAGKGQAAVKRST